MAGANPKWIEWPKKSIRYAKSDMLLGPGIYNVNVNLTVSQSLNINSNFHTLYSCLHHF